MGVDDPIISVIADGPSAWMLCPGKQAVADPAKTTNKSSATAGMADRGLKADLSLELNGQKEIFKI